MNPIQTHQEHFGATAGNYSPSAADRRQQQIAQARMTRLVGQAALLDPYIQQKAEQAVRAQMESGADAQAVRRAVYDTAQGQLARDGMLALRVGGFLGQGNPVEYARNIANATMRGFTGSVYDASGQLEQFGGRISGSGMVAERAAESVQRMVMRNLYGEDNAHPGNNMGFNMSESSELFGVMARQMGGMRNLVTVKHGASFDDVVQGEQQRITDRTLRRSLDGLTSENIDERILAAQEGEDDKTADYLENLRTVVNSKGAMAVITNEQAVKTVTDAQQQLQQSLGLLADVYGAIDPQVLSQTLHDLGIADTMAGRTQLLNSVTGFEARDERTAARQRAMLQNLTNATNVNDSIDARFALGLMIDPEVARANQQRVGQYTGLDERERAPLLQFTQAVNAGAIEQMAIMGQRGRQTAARLNDMGINVRAQDETAIKADLDRMDATFGTLYAGIDALLAAMPNLSPEARAIGEGILQEFEAAQDANERGAADQKARNLVGRELGHEGSFDLYRKSAQYGDSLQQLAGDSDAMARRSGMQMPMMNQAVSMAATENILGNEMGLARGDAKKLFMNVGGEGLTDMLTAEKLTPEERERMLNQVAEDAGVDRELLDQFYNADGELINPEAFARITRDVTASRVYSDLTRRRGLRDKINTAEFDTKPLMQDDKMTFRSVMNAVITGKAEARSPHVTAHALRLAKEEGLGSMLVAARDKDGNVIKNEDGTDKMIDVTEQVTQLDLSGGLTEDALATIKRLDPSFNLAESLGMTDEQLVGNTDPEMIDRAMRKIRESSNLVTAGNARDLTVMSKDVDMAEVARRSQRVAAYDALNPLLQEGESSDVRAALWETDGEGVTADHLVETDEGVKGSRRLGGLAKVIGKNALSTLDPRNLMSPAHRMQGIHENFQRVTDWWSTSEKDVELAQQDMMAQRAEAVMGADAGSLEAIRALDPDGKHAEGFLTQAEELRKQLSSGNTLHMRDENGEMQEMTEQMVKQQIEMLEQAHDRLKGIETLGQQNVRTLRVENMEVINSK